MHAGVWSYIVSTGQTWTVGVTGATGYAGGEVCRLLAGHPNLRLAGVHANASAGRRLGELQPHLLPRRHGGPAERPGDAGRLRRRRPGAAARGLRRRSPRTRRGHPRRSTAAPTTGLTDGRLGRSSAASTPAHGPTACPSYPGGRCTAPPDRRTRVLPDGRSPLRCPGAHRTGRARGGRGRRQRHVGRGQVAPSRTCSAPR